MLEWRTVNPAREAVLYRDGVLIARVDRGCGDLFYWVTVANQSGRKPSMDAAKRAAEESLGVRV